MLGQVITHLHTNCAAGIPSYTPPTDQIDQIMSISWADRDIPDLYDLYDLYDLPHVAGWNPYNPHDLAMFPGLDRYYQHADPAHPPTAAGEELNDLHDLDHDLSVRGVHSC